MFSPNRPSVSTVVLRTRPHPLQARGEGLVKSLHTHVRVMHVECDKHNEYLLLLGGCLVETHAVDLSRAMEQAR